MKHTHVYDYICVNALQLCKDIKVIYMQKCKHLQLNDSMYYERHIDINVNMYI